MTRQPEQTKPAASAVEQAACAAIDQEVDLGRPAHPLAAWAWSVLRDRSIADKMFVLTACDRRLGRRDMPEKQERAYNAISLFVEAVGHLPHANEWDEWRRASEDRKQLPSATFIRNAFGGWGDLRACFEATPDCDVLSARLTSRGSAFTDEELQDVLQAWASETDEPLTWEGLQAWLDSGGPARAGVSRAPLHVQTFTRGRGTFADALEAAGLSHRGTTAVQAAAWRRRPVAVLREQLLSELRCWAAVQPGLLYHADFVSHLIQLEAGHDLAGLRDASTVLRRVLGTWDRALLAPGSPAAARQRTPADTARRNPTSTHILVASKRMIGRFSATGSERPLPPASARK